MIKKLKRQAEILSKECDLSHSAALNLASKLNGFKDYHQAQKENSAPEVAPPPSKNFYIDVDPQGIVLVRGPSATERIGLPVYATESRERAMSLITLLCSKSYNGDYYLLPRSLFNPDLPQLKSVKQLQAVKEAFAKADKESFTLRVSKAISEVLTGSNCYKVKARTTAEVTTFFTVFGTDLQDAVSKANSKVEDRGYEDWEVTYIEGPTKITDVANELDPKDYLMDEDGLR